MNCICHSQNFIALRDMKVIKTILKNPQIVLIAQTVLMIKLIVYYLYEFAQVKNIN